MSIDMTNLAEVQAMLAQLREAQKGLRDADNARLGALVQEFAETVVAERAIESSEKSGWHGIKVYALPIVVAGTKFTFSGTLTDVVASDAAKKALKDSGAPVAEEADETVSA